MDTPGSVKTKIETVYLAIHESPAKKYYISDLAKHAGLTTETLKTAFKEQYGFTIPEWITRSKMERARLMLQYGQPIKQVAAELGYKQVVNFHKTFKRLTGLTPGQYIEKYKSGL